MKQVPYTTRSRLQIGIHYQPPQRQEFIPEMDHLQTALIGRGRPIKSISKEMKGLVVLASIMLACILVANCGGAA